MTQSLLQATRLLVPFSSASILRYSSCYRPRNVVFYIKDLLSMRQEEAADSDLAQDIYKALNELQAVFMV